MGKRLILLVQLQPLLGEGLRRIFQKLEDVELVCLPCTDLQKIDACLQDLHPDMVLLAGEKEDDHDTLLIARLLKRYENIPIVWAEVETNVLRLYTSHSLTANSTALIHAIRESEERKTEVYPIETKKDSRP